MRISKYSILSTALGFLLLFSLILVESRAKSIHGSGSKPDLERLVSAYPPGWTMVEGPLVDPGWDKSALSAYDIVVTRRYRHPDGSLVSVVMTWSADGVHREGHQQEICYNAQGFTTGPTQRISIMTSAGKLDASAFTAIQGAVMENVVYWLVSDAIVLRDTDRLKKLRHLPRLLTGEFPDNMMVRVSGLSPFKGQNTTAHIDYIKEWLAAMHPTDRVRIMGR